MAEVLGILKCVGSIIPQCIPPELKDKLTRPVSYVIFYGANAAEISTKIEQLKGEKVEVEARWLVAETNGEQILHKIQEWLNRTNEILQKFDSPENKNCLCGTCEVGKMVDDIKQLLDESQCFLRVSYPGIPPPVGSRYQAYNKSLKSREEILGNVLKALEDESINMISLDGIPGVGKTTLLEELIKRVEADKQYQVVAIVDVSQTVDIKMIQVSIAARIQLEFPEQCDDGTRANLLYRQLEAMLVNKKSKILILLDDICTENGIDLGKIGIPFLTKGKPSCTILISSRSSNVSRTMDGKCSFSLGCLNLAEAKVLFRDRLQNQIANQEYMSERYISIENGLLQKCGGLPRAITALAEVLKLRWPDLDDVVDQLRNHNLSEVDGVTKTLHRSIKLNYDLLESHKKKQFFLLCCLLRPGTSITIEDLVRFGIGLNLFGKIMSLDDVTRTANSWVNQLKSLSLFENTDNQGSISVHNIIQEFAISTASDGNYLLLLDDGARWESKEIFRSYTIICMTARSNVSDRHLNGQEMPQTPCDFEHLCDLKLPKLKALFFEGKSSKLTGNCFTEMENLTLLVMTKIELSIGPLSVEHLKHLLTLSLEYCEIEDASFISVLLSLKVLSFRGSKLNTFPSGITHLGGLRLLDLTECCFGTTLDGVLANLSHLEGLYTTGVATGSRDVEGLKSFNRLNALEMDIQNPASLNGGDLLLGHNPQARESNQPERFKIAIGCQVSSLYKNFCFRRVLLLEKIDARNIRQHGFKNLLKKTECLSLSEITDLKKVFYDLDEEGLVHLNYLRISNCHQMQCIVNACGSFDEIKILPQLETLYLEQLDGLKVIYHGQTPQYWRSKLRELKLLNLKVLEHYALLIDHAHELAKVKVRNCSSLKHIFSAGSTSGSSTTEECYEFPCLKKLKLQALPMLEGLCAQGSRSSNQLLINEKINLPALEKLYLSSLGKINELWKPSSGDSASSKAVFLKLQILKLDNMPGLKHVWSKEILERSSRFPRLEKIIIVDCELLESLCRPSILAALSKLDTLEISSCSNLKEIVMPETNAHRAIKFPSLGRLKLEKLPSLQYFGQGNYKIEFPYLEKLHIFALPKMLKFHEPLNPANKMPFFREIVFPSLEHLNLTAMEDIEELIQEEHATITFPKLKTLNIKELGKLRFIPATLLEKLEQLNVQSCGLLQGLFDGNLATSMISLRKVELFDVSCLQNMPLKLIPNIQSLVIHGGLLYVKSMLSTTAIVEGGVVQKLEYISIKGCDHLEEIVSKVCDQSCLLDMGVTMFPRLKHVEFHSLRSFTTFSSGSYEATLPALKKLEINSCPNLKSFSSGELKLPALEEVEINSCPNLKSFSSGELYTPKLCFVKVDEAFTSGMNVNINNSLQSGKKDSHEGNENSKRLEPIAKLTQEKTESPLNSEKEIVPFPIASSSHSSSIPYTSCKTNSLAEMHSR